jgi:asparagine synthase (glutamine-hydrolysing)
MCGIAGIWSDDISRDAREVLVRQMLQCMSERGPDATRVVHEAGCTVGFNLLAIAAGPGEHDGGSYQPMRLFSVIGAMNGEVYNHHRLRRALDRTAPGMGRPEDDCAVLLPLYSRNPAGFLRDLDGIFAGVVFDSARQQLLLFRDHVGIKPLFYTRLPQGIAFASTVLGFRPLTSAKISKRAMRDYLTSGYVRTPQTLIDGVLSVPPGTVMGWRSPKGQPRAERWFRPDGAMRDLRQVISEAVETEVPAGWPVVSTLSGGVDSTLITLLLQAAGARPTALTVGYPDAQDDPDVLTARRVCEDFAIDHVEVPVTADDYLREVTGGWRFDQPLADPNAIALNLLCRQAGKLGTRVLLTGDGSDELFCGYDYYRTPAAGGLSGYLASWTFTSMTEPRDRRFARYVTGKPRPRPVRPHLGEPLRHVQDSDISQWLEPNLLAKADRFGMADQVEIRVPLLRPAIVSAALALPARLKVANGVTKVALREAFGDMLPRYVLKRSKQGFPCPLATWLRGNMGQELRRGATWAVDGVWDVAREQELWDEHVTGRADWSQQLWRLAIARAWWRTMTTPPTR